jgi:hypothetical protein
MAMKAKLHDQVVTLVDVQSDVDDRVIPRGTQGTIVERYDQSVEGYAIDLALPDPRLVGGHAFVSVTLAPDQFEVVASVPAARASGAS